MRTNNFGKALWKMRTPIMLNPCLFYNTDGPVEVILSFPIILYHPLIRLGDGKCHEQFYTTVISQQLGKRIEDTYRIKDWFIYYTDLNLSTMTIEKTDNDAGEYAGVVSLVLKFCKKI
jgi:hypothetical protein